MISSDLQYALDQIKARHQEVGRADSAEGTFALDQSQADVPRLVEAIEAVARYCDEVTAGDWVHDGELMQAEVIQDMLTAKLTEEKPS